jgi:transposase
MPKPLELKLSEGQRRELEVIRDQDRRAYMRERSAALLKIAAGQSGREVARNGLLRPRYPEAVYRWYKRYQEHGVKGLEITPGAGRKPSFSPSVPR